MDKSPKEFGKSTELSELVTELSDNVTKQNIRDTEQSGLVTELSDKVPIEKDNYTEASGLVTEINKINSYNQYLQNNFPQTTNFQLNNKKQKKYGNNRFYSKD